MSSATISTTLEEQAEASPSIPASPLRWPKLTAYTLFGSLLLLDSLYLILCYITFDFYGALNSPFFGWLRTGAFAAQILYFPLFAGALLSVDVGQVGREKRRSQALAAIFLLAQIVVGFLLYFSPGKKEYLGWPLVYGPNIRMPSGDIVTYFEALACLVPLIWISALHIRASFRAAGATSIPNKLKLSSFVAAAAAASLLYEATAVSRLVKEAIALPFGVLGFVLAAHLVIFLAAFLILQWIRIIATRFADPGLVQFALRCLAVWMILEMVFRKVVFALLGFNDLYADCYAIAFSFALVIFPATLILRRKQRSSAQAKSEDSPRSFKSWGLRSCFAAGIAILFYICAVKFAAIDWAHVIGSLGALAIWAGILWLCSAIPRGQHNYSLVFVILLSLVCAGGIAGVTVGTMRGQLADSLEEYGDYDTAAFVIQHAFKPALQDEKYAAWYDFLNRHANIRPAVSAPEVPLVGELTPVKGPKPNIFLLVIDALRSDYVSAYNPAVTFTPNMGAFARESVVFHHAYSTYAGTALADPGLWSGFQQINKTFAQPLSRENKLQPMLNVDGYDCYISYNTIVGFLAGKAEGITRLETDRSDQLDFGPIAEELEADLSKRKDTQRPIFAFAQPTNVHTLSLAWHGGKVEVKPHPGFNDAYASGVERVDETFGKFIAFLKQQGLYDNSIVIVTADHGESLGEMGRESHVTNVTPEVIDVPLIIHLPEWEKSKMVWNTEAVATLHDITPTLYYLVGHRPLNQGEMLGHPLFTMTAEEQNTAHPDHYFLMSSYGAVFGVLSADQKSLFMVDAILHRNYYYDLQDDPHALKNRVTTTIRDHYEPVIHHDLEKIDEFYGVSEQELGP